MPLVLNLVPALEGLYLSHIVSNWIVIPFSACGAVLLFSHQQTTVAAVRRVAASAAVFFAILVAGLSSRFWVHFDLTPMANHVRELMEQDIPVAWYGGYQGRLHFLGRLHHPLAEVTSADELADWLDANPNGRVVFRAIRSVEAIDVPLPLTDDAQRSLVNALNSRSGLCDRYRVSGIDTAQEIHRGLPLNLLTLLRFDRRTETAVTAEPPTTGSVRDEPRTASIRRE
ncbi:MAG: hypothetical protein R3C19_13315 [Planctomycetaceae bacterium]